MDLEIFKKHFLDGPAFEVAHETVVAQRYASIALTVWRPLGIVTSLSGFGTLYRDDFKH